MHRLPWVSETIRLMFSLWCLLEQEAPEGELVVFGTGLEGEPLL